MSEDNDNVLSVSGNIIIFSFLSIIFIFVVLLMLGGFNNFGLQTVYSFVEGLISSGVVSSVMTPTLEGYTGLDIFIPYIDYFWLAAFIILFLGSVVFSYNLERKNLFETFSFSVVGIIVFTFVGSYFIQITTWFQTEILERVFPNILDQMPFFSWYLDNVGLVNLILIVLCVIANFINLDFTKFKLKKGGDSIEEL